MRSSLDTHLRRKLPSDHHVWTWAVEYGAALLNFSEPDSDNRTAFERCRGKRGRVYDAEFGEKVIWRFGVRDRSQGSSRSS